MKKLYKTPLTRSFSAQIAANFPSFKLAPVLEKKHLYSHGSHFVEQVRAGHWLFISLLPDARASHEYFSVEIGWSRLGRIPETTDGRAVPNFKKEWMDKQEFNSYLVGNNQIGGWQLERVFDPLPHQLTGLPLSAEIAMQVVDSIMPEVMATLIKDGGPILEMMRTRLMEEI